MKRLYIQIVAFFATNANLMGFLKGSIFQGKSKYICVPGLNCYSCPGALGACPIGALQAVFGSAKQKVSYYVVGLLILFATTMGRWICGFLCPFGLLQDLVYKIKSKKVSLGKKFGFLKYLKYVILVVMVILLPSLLVNQYGNGAPYFCAYLCPSGTFFGALPLLIANPTMIAPLISWQFWYKVWILIAILVASVFNYRFFCKVLCPLGAFYGLFNRISFVRLEIDKEKCVDCGACKRACKMEIDPKQTPNNVECIRCMDCVKSCKFDALNRTRILTKKLETLNPD